MMDVPSIDRNLQALKAVERSWGLPAMPDMVKLDIAALSGMEAPDIQRFAGGLAEDIESANRKPTPIVNLTVGGNIELTSSSEPVDQKKGYSIQQNTQRYLAAISGADRPTQLTSNAVSAWKQRAVQLGYLPSDTPIDNSWTPAYNTIMGEMRRDDFGRRFAGDNLVSVPIRAGDDGGAGVLELMDEWLSPTGLFKAAVQLDFLPDFKKWGSDLKKISWNPVSWWKAVDDAIFPVLNVGLMLTGVGEVALIGRGLLASKGLTGMKAIKGIDSMTETSRVARILGRSASPEHALAGVRRQGLLASRFGQSERATLNSLGKGMDAWRNLAPVSMAKGVTQQTMRLGLAQKTEDFIGFEGWEAASLDAIPGISTFAEGVHENLLTAVAADMALTPVTVFNPGQFGGLSPFNVVRKFANVGDHAVVGEELTSAMMASLMKLEADGVEGAADKVVRFKKTKKKYGNKAALAEELFGADPSQPLPEIIESKIGAWATYVATSAALDAAAYARHSEVVKVSQTDVAGEGRFSQRFHTIRNNLINQLRYIDPEDAESMLVAHIWSAAKDAEEAGRMMEAMLPKLQENMFFGIKLSSKQFRAMMSDYANAHNAKRQELFEQLLEQHLKPGVLEEYFLRHLGDYGHGWDDFVDVSYKIDESWDLSGAQIAQAVDGEIGAQGTRLNPLDMIGDGSSGPLTYTVGIEDLVKDPEFLNFANSKAGVFRPLLKGTTDKGRFTIMRKDGKTKQDYLREIASIRRLMFLHDKVGEIKALTSKHGGVKLKKQLENILTNKVLIRNIGIANGGELQQALKAAGYKPGGDEFRRIKRVVQWARNQDIDYKSWDEIESALAKRLNDVDRHDSWLRDWKIDPDIPLADKVKHLQTKSNFTASGIDPASLPKEVVEELDRAGYKLVHGVEYMTPKDVLHFDVEIADLVDKTKDIESLGLSSRFQRHLQEKSMRYARKYGQTFLRHEPDHVRRLYTRQLKDRIKYYFPDAEDAEIVAMIEGPLKKIVSIIATSMGDLQARKIYENAVQKGYTNLKSSFSPTVPTDLVRNRGIWKEAEQLLRTGKYAKEGRKFSKKEINNLYNALKEAKVVGPQHRGTFIDWLDRVQATPNLTNTMRLLGRVDTGSAPKSVGVFATRAAGAIAGGYAYGDYIADDNSRYNPFSEDASVWDSLGALIGGATAVAAGRAGATRLLVGSQKKFLKGADLQNSFQKFFNARLYTSDTAGKLAPMKRLSAYANRIDSYTMSERSLLKHWSYTGDAAANLRDYMRFSLSPIFDASRYSEGAILSQIALPEEVQMAGGVRMNMSPSKWRKEVATKRAKEVGGNWKDHQDFAMDAWKEIRSRYIDAQSVFGDFDYDALEAATARFSQVGILGFNTHEWETSMFADLVLLHGMDDIEAYKLSKKVFTYGVNPRSAAEMNVNAIFFPFSFTKKTLGHAAQFAMQDWSRTVMIHNQLRLYDALDEKYDIRGIMEDRLPLLDKLQRLNLLANGIAPGQFGGANRPFLDVFEATPVGSGLIDPVKNLFAPQFVNMNNNKDLNDVIDTMTRVLPAFNDVRALSEDLQQQGHVIFSSPTHRTQDAENRVARAESLAMKETLDAHLKSMGIEDGFKAINRKGFENIRTWWENFQLGLDERYPGYKESRFSSAGYAQARTQDRKEYIAHMEIAKESGQSSDEWSSKAKVGWLITYAEALTRAYGGNALDPTAFVPAFYTDDLIRRAISWAEDDPEVALGWIKHLKRNWGPIEEVMY